MKYPQWFPYPSSWLNALLVMGLAVVAGRVAIVTLFAGYALAHLDRSFVSFTITSAFFLLAPVFVVTLIHHLFHLFLSQFLPSLQAPEIGKVTGALPTLFSWWEGLLSWTVMTTATIMTCTIGVIFAPIFDIDIHHLDRFNFRDMSQADLERFSWFAGFVWLTTAAYLYQCFYLVETRLMAVGKKLAEERSTRSNFNSSIKQNRFQQ